MGIIKDAFDRYVYRQLDDDELQECLLTEAIADDLEEAGDWDGKVDLLFYGLPELDDDAE